MCNHVTNIVNSGVDDIGHVRTVNVMEFIKFINNKILWGVPMLVLLLASGIYLLIVTRAVVFTHFGFMIKNTVRMLLKKDDHSEITPFAAMSAALAATAGTGNITGVALAIRLGGPGAVFWMWVSGLLGMVIKYSEVLLAVKYRKKTKDGFSGGPMYYMAKGLSAKKLPFVFCFFAVLSSFGIGNAVQANAFASGVNSVFRLSPPASGVLLAALCFLILSGGFKRISDFSKIFVPVTAMLYISIALFILATNISKIPSCFSLIIKSAFSDLAPIGGFTGATVAHSARIGISRGLFTNEAGLGSSPIAHASAENAAPITQGMFGAFEVFFDTIIMCGMTALVILVSGVWQTDCENALLAHTAFSQNFPNGGYIVCFGLVLFSFASIIAWYHYGESCFKYLFKDKYTELYKIMYVFVSLLGCMCEITFVWECADTLNAFMMLPNIIALIFLAEEVGKITKNYPF